MYKIDDYVVYKREVCKVKEIKEKYFKGIDYYSLVPVSDESLKIDVPVNSNLLRDLITKAEIDELILKIPDIQVIKSDSRLIENEYKVLLASEKYEDLIRIIKTTYLRNKNRLDHHKRTGDKDNYYFLKAEGYLFGEFAVVLNKSLDETKEYVIRKVQELEK